VPLQKPYPRVWIPGVFSPETIVWAAKQRYPYVALNTSIEATKKIWELYDKVRSKPATVAAREYRGYLQQVHVSDSEEKADRRTPASSYGCRASSPASRIRYGRRRRAISRPSQSPRNSSNSRSAGSKSPRGRPTFERRSPTGDDHRRHAEDR
jgi:alkanesulfonate monooxygenase SsuD/methylene tetrahydromethanopterin reductase-like flavin-dependent oxidoreductase (luciferase family)